MKSTLISPKKKVVTPSLPEYPALYRSKQGVIVLATSRTGGVVVHAGDSNLQDVGYVYHEGTTAWLSCYPDWVRITDPTTIKFTP